MTEESRPTETLRPAWAIKLQANRDARQWSKWKMARKLMQAADIQHGSERNLARQILDWEKGLHFPRDWATAYAKAFDMPKEELFATPQRSKPPESQESPQNHRVKAGAGTLTISINPDLLDGDMERRVLLQLAALGMSAGTLGTEALDRLVDLVLTAGPRDLDGWHLACADHLYALHTRPPADVRQDLMIDLLALDRQLDVVDAGEHTELKRVQAALATLQANALTRLGDHGSAIRWWRIAKAAADTTGDLNLRLLVRSEEADTGLYGQRDPATVVQLTDAAKRLDGATASIWSAGLAGTRATALTLQGRHGEALRELRTCADFTGEEAPEGILPTLWKEDRIHYAASWVHAGAGREAKADAARDILLARTRGYQSATNVRLHEALCTVTNGGTDTGAQQASEILATLPSTRRSHMILETGKAVLRAVPVEQRERPAVRELRALTG